MITVKRTSKASEVDDKLLEKVAEIIYPDNLTEDKPKPKKGRKKKDASIEIS